MSLDHSLFIVILVAVTVIKGYDDQKDVMKGWQIQKYGLLDELQYRLNITVPTIIKPTEILIEVLTTSINQLDVLMIRGYGRNVLNVLRWMDGIPEFPMTLGRDFCGIVRGKGKLVNENMRIGDKVWGVIEPHQIGAHAQYVVVDQKYITHKPDTIDDIGAGGIFYAGLTAWSSLDGADFFGRRGMKVCILGASGGVGSLAVQIAKAEGAEVTATCSTSAIPLVKKLGADRIIDYTSKNADEQFRGLYFDIILDTAGLGSDYPRRVPWKFNTYVTLEPPLLNNTDSNGLILGSLQSVMSLVNNNLQSLWIQEGIIKWGFFQANREGIEYITELTRLNKIKPVIDSVFELDTTHKAFKKMAGGHTRGKIIVRMK